MDCLHSLRKTEYDPLEIIVVDNHSEDDSVAYVREHFPETILVENEENRGFAGGCNDGADQANGKYLLILNNDTTQEPDWVTHLVRFMEANPSIGVAQPKLINAKDPASFDYSGAAGGFMDRYGFPFARGRIFENVEKDHGQYDDPVQTFWASGTACMIRAEVLTQIGLFDETFFAHMEEIDFDWRAQIAGWDIAVAPQSKVYHHSGFTLPPESPFKKYLNHRNSVFMLLSNYHLWNTIFRGLQRWLLDWMALVFSIARADWSRAWAIIKTWIWIISHPHIIVKKRRQVAAIRRRSDREMDQRLYSASIALEFNLFRKKTWDVDRHAIVGTDVEITEISKHE